MYMSLTDTEPAADHISIKAKLWVKSQFSIMGGRNWISKTYAVSIYMVCVINQCTMYNTNVRKTICELKLTDLWP